MTTDAATPTAEPSAEAEGFQPLNMHERRVLGVLQEKAKTTPDVYPLTLNALITGCNQKSNREPVLNLSDVEVEAALDTLKKKGLAQQIMGGGRVDKLRHVSYDVWRVDKVQLAILTELLLRGPQTEGELRTRASRMEPIADLDSLRVQLRGLAERGLVVYLTPEGRRGTTVTHGFHSAEELQRLRARADRGEAELAESAVPPVPHAATGDVVQRLANLEASVAEMRTALQSLQATVESLRAEQAPPATDPRG
jgi:uncharacterized protein YceH (UPF0502 family)